MPALVDELSLERQLLAEKERVASLERSVVILRDEVDHGRAMCEQYQDLVATLRQEKYALEQTLARAVNRSDAA